MPASSFFHVWIMLPGEAYVDQVMSLCLRDKLTVSPLASDGDLYELPSRKDGEVAGSCLLALRIGTHSSHGTEGKLTASDMNGLLFKILEKIRYLGYVVREAEGTSSWRPGNITFPADQTKVAAPNLPLTSFERLNAD